MSDMPKDYTKEKKDRTHYAVGSFQERICKEQYNKQPKYCYPGDASESGEMHGEHRNTQTGP